MQGSEVGLPQPSGSGIFETAIYVLPANACVWAGCGCVFGGNGISVTDVDY